MRRLSSPTPQNPYRAGAGSPFPAPFPQNLLCAGAGCTFSPSPHASVSAARRRGLAFLPPPLPGVCSALDGEGEKDPVATAARNHLLPDCSTLQSELASFRDEFLQHRVEIRGLRDLRGRAGCLFSKEMPRTAADTVAQVFAANAQKGAQLGSYGMEMWAEITCAGSQSTVQVTQISTSEMNGSGSSFQKLYTEEQARKLGLVGWVKNTAGGTVTGQVQGPVAKVNFMMNWLKSVGSPMSRIDKAHFSNERDISKLDFDTFSTKY